MAATNRRRRDLTIILLLAGLPFFLLYVSTRPGEDRPKLDRGLVATTAPLQLLVANVFGGLADLWNDYLVLADVQRENRDLRREVARLSQENRRLAALAVENTRLREMLAFRDHHDGDYTLFAARVIGRSITPYFRVVRLRLQLGAGRVPVQEGMPVITREGVVGTIERVSSGYADVMLLVDARSAIDVISQENRVRGIIKGQGETDRYAARMEYTLRTDELKPGEVLVTSGMGRRFPRDLVVGKVESIEKKQYGLYQKVTVSPAVDFSRLEEVFVITSAPEPLLPEQLDKPTPTTPTPATGKTPTPTASPTAAAPGAPPLPPPQPAASPAPAGAPAPASPAPATLGPLSRPPAATAPVLVPSPALAPAPRPTAGQAPAPRPTAGQTPAPRPTPLPLPVPRPAPTPTATLGVH